MSFKRNLTAVYASQIITTLLGVLAVPLLVRAMGLESYGLIGIYVTLQGWFTLLDIGFSPALARESSRLSAGAIAPQDYLSIYKVISIFFIVCGILISLALIFVSQTFATRWISAHLLTEATISKSLLMMGPALGMRFISSFYKAVLSGFEKLFLISYVTIAVSIARFVLVIPILYYVDRSVVVYFYFQVIVSFLELIYLRVRARRCLPRKTIRGPADGTSEIRRVLRFSTQFGLATLAWVFVSQSDSLILSAILPLKAYGVFVVVTLAASAVLIAASPTGSVIIPRLTYLHAQHRSVDVRDLYNKSVKFVAVGTSIISSSLLFFPGQVLLAWTGRLDVADAGPVLTFYAAGNMILALTGFPMFLQSAHGDVRFHLRGQLAFAFLIVPIVAVSAISFGMLGAAVSWFVGNLLYFLVYVALVHRRFMPGNHVLWLRAVIFALMPAILAAGALRFMIEPSTARLPALVQVVLCMLVASIAAICSLRWLRDEVINVTSSLFFHPS